MRRRSQRVERVLGMAYYAVARPVERDMEALCRAAWEEIEPLDFDTFAVRVKRSDKTFPHGTIEIETVVGRYVLERLRASGRNVRVKLNDPELTCRIEITPGPLLVYARKIPGAGGLPANTAGRMICLLSGGYDSAVAAYHMMKRGSHLSFVHFYGTGARPGESSLHVASALVRRLVPYQFRAKLYRVPFEAYPAGDRAVRARECSRAFVQADDAANRRSVCAARSSAGDRQWRQPWSGGVADAAQSCRSGGGGDDADFPPSHRHRQDGNSRDGAQNWDVRYFVRAFP